MLDQPVELFETLSASLLSPRLSVLITTVSPRGQINAAPFSFFTPISYVPPRVCFSIGYTKHHSELGAHYAVLKPIKEILDLEQYAAETEETLKDTLVNILEEGEFGVNVMPIEYLHQIVITSSRYPYGVNEMEVAGLTPYPSTKIKPPLVKEAKVALECVKIADYPVVTGPNSQTLVIGEVVACHVDSEIIEGSEIKPERMRSILQVAGPTFGVCTEFHYDPRYPYPDVIPNPTCSNH